jgi:predicted nucleic acid-binding protein
VLASLGDEEAIVPEIWILEVLNVLLAAVRANRIERVDSSRFLQLLSGLPISEISRSSLFENSLTLDLARQHNLSAYNASYLELAIREAAPIATQDSRLIEACRKSGVALFGSDLG